MISNLDSDNLPPGFEDLGDAADLSPEKIAELAKSKAAGITPAPVQWREDPENEGQFFPLLYINEHFFKVGGPRPFKEFLPNERTMFVMAFANDVSAWLFGEPMYHEDFTEASTNFTPNPAFHELPTQTPDAS